jgi:hypothetical protein
MSELCDWPCCRGIGFQYVPAKRFDPRKLRILRLSEEKQSITAQAIASRYGDGAVIVLKREEQVVLHIEFGDF